MFRDFTETAREVASTRRRSLKEQLLAEYFTALDDAALERAAVFFTGSPFPRFEQRVTGVGWATVADAAAEAAGVSREEIAVAAVRHGDLGDALVDFFLERSVDAI